MQVFVGGMPANDDFSTEVWQYRQSMPLPPTCRSWLNWMGCSRATWTSVTHGDALTRSNSQSSAATAKTAPKILSLEMVLVLRWKICDIGRAIHGSRNRFVQTQSLLIRRGRDLRSIARTQRVARKPREFGVRLENLMAEL